LIAGYVGIAMSLGILIAPLLGGVVFASGGYNAVFAMQYALIALDIIMRFALVEMKVAKKWTEQEPRQVSQSHQSPPTDEKKNDDVAQANPSPATAVSTAPSSRLPPVLTLLGSARLLAGMWGVLVIAALMTSFDAVLPLFVHDTFGWNSLGAGLVYIAIVVPSFIGPIAGWLADRYGPRWILTVGFVSCVPWLVMLRLVDHNSIGQKVLLCTLLALLGVCLNCVLAPIMAEVSYIVEAKEQRARRHGMPSPFGQGGAYAQAYALFNTAFSAGAIAGPFWAGFVKESAGWATMAWSLALLSGVSAIPTAIWAGGSIRKAYSRTRSAPANAV
jgi:MFS family permease